MILAVLHQSHFSPQSSADKSQSNSAFLFGGNLLSPWVQMMRGLCPSPFHSFVWTFWPIHGLAH